MTYINSIKAKSLKPVLDYDILVQQVSTFLDEQKAEHITHIDLRGKASFADGMLIATGRSQRHIKALAEKLKQVLHEAGITDVYLEGANACDWVLIDGGDIIIHLFRDEMREFYNLEKMWLKEPRDSVKELPTEIKE